MKQTLLSIATVAALGLSTSATAQYSDRRPTSDSGRSIGGAGAADMSARIEQLQVRVRTGVQNGTITRPEAATLRQQIRQLYQLESQYSANGFSRQETADLQDEYRDVRQQVRVAEAASQYDNDDGESAGAGNQPARKSGIDRIIDRVAGEPR